MNIINDEHIINFFHLETVSNNPDEHRYERRKLITPLQNKFEGKKYNKKLLDENIYQYLANRYNDAECINEILYRILHKIEIRPVCPVCGAHLEFQLLSCGFKDYDTPECRYKHKGEMMRIHPEKPKHATEITSINDVNDKVIIDFFLTNKTARESSILVNSYIMKQIKGETIKYNKYNSYIYEYLINRFNDTKQIGEIIYRIANNINEVPKCKVCGKPCEFIGLSDGYRQFCSRKCYLIYSEDRTKLRTEHERNKKELKFHIKYEDKFNKKVDDNVIKEIFANNKSYEEQEKIRETYIRQYNEHRLGKKVKVYEDVLEYLLNRYSDSQSLRESIYRIINNVETRPVCVKCGKPVLFIGKPSVTWGMYCSNECKYIDAKERINSEFNPRSVSKTEISIREEIKQLFPDTEGTYNDNLYKHNCDIYIPSLKLYIEFQGFYTHGGRPYMNTEEDNKYANFLAEKHGQWAKESWIITDVSKRKDAKDNNINYMELWPRDTGKKRKTKILNTLKEMIGKDDSFIRNKIIELSDYPTIYNGVYLGEESL